MRLVSGAEILELDKSVGIPSLVLMENAGLAVANYIVQKFEGKKVSVAIIVGGGNNGADGLVVARKLFTLGINVKVFPTSDPPYSYKSEEAMTNLHLTRDIIKVPFCDSFGEISQFNVIVDAILGAGSRAGTSSKNSEIFQSIFDQINACRSERGASVVAVDIPSGICPTSGIKLYDRPVKADATITFGVVKSGLIFYPAASFVGEVVLASICFPREISSATNLNFSLTPVPTLSPRDPLGHKGTFGKVFVIAGSDQYYGAPLFSSLSFLRSGGGYARLFCSDSVSSVVAASAPEIVQLGDSWTIVSTNFLCNDSDVVIVGPGIGLGSSAEDKMSACIDMLCGETRKKVKAIILDGDALTLLSNPTSSLRDIVTRLSGVGIQVILTPHPGELARLFNISAESEYERIVATQKKLAEEFSVNACPIIVVKGARSATVNSQSIYVNRTGNSGMATCGSGDVLTGIIGSTICNYSGTIIEAVAAAVFIHGLAGDLAAQSIGEDGMVASDILNLVPEAMKRIRLQRIDLERIYIPRIV
jgi:hydroxyethylthiazole kinase-like uncharacterized protein yjeF